METKKTILKEYVLFFYSQLLHQNCILKLILQNFNDLINNFKIQVNKSITKGKLVNKPTQKIKCVKDYNIIDSIQ